MSAAIRSSGLLCLMLISNPLYAAYQLNLKPGVSPYSQGAYDIHQMVMWICLGIGIVVFGAMFYSIINHRKSKHAKASTFHESYRNCLDYHSNSYTYRHGDSCY